MRLQLRVLHSVTDVISTVPDYTAIGASGFGFRAKRSATLDGMFPVDSARGRGFFPTAVLLASTLCSRRSYDCRFRTLRAGCRPEGRRTHSFTLAVVAFASSLWWSDSLAAQNVLSKALQDRVQENPHTTEADVEAGAKVFQRSCSLCHGADGTGGDGPDLTRGVFRHGSSDAALFRNILTGISNTGMGGIYQPDKSIWQVVSYVRSLSRGGGEEEVPGDPRRGRMLYMSRGSCSDCHRLNGSGGRLGPDLSDLGWRRAPDHIRASIAEPSEAIDRTYRTVEVRTQSGAIVRGVLRNEDRYSIQLLDEFENLRSFQKADLAAIEKPEESLMPPLGSFFRGRDLDDLVAYLYSLRPE